MTAAAAFTSPAMAQNVTGTIDLEGTVSAKCFVVPGNGGTFDADVDFEALDEDDGTLRTDLGTTFDTKSFTVKCNSGTVDLSIEATPLANTATAAAGYDNSINYTATLTVDMTTGTKTVDDLSSGAGATTDTTTLPLKNADGNVQITTSGYATNNSTDLLVAGNYTGTITVVISPN